MGGWNPGWLKFESNLHNSFNLFHMTTTVHDRHENLLLTYKLGEQLSYVTDYIIRYVQPFLILLSNAEFDKAVVNYMLKDMG